MSSSSRAAARAGGGPAGKAGSSPAKRRPASLGAAAAPGQEAAAAGQAQEASSDLKIIQNPHHFSNNASVVYFLRIFMTIVAGAAVGVLGVEGWGGFTGYLLSQLLCTLPILAKCGGNYEKYLATWDKVYLEHIFSSTAILSYILFWMMFYNICHVF